MAQAIARAISRSVVTGNSMERVVERVGTDECEGQAAAAGTRASCLVRVDGSALVTLWREIEGEMILVARLVYAVSDADPLGGLRIEAPSPPSAPTRA